MVHSKQIHEDTLWRGHRAVISFILTKQISLHFYCHITDILIKQTKNSLDDDGTGVKPEHFIKRGMIYTSSCDTIKKIWNRDRNIARDNFSRKRRSTGFIYLIGSKSCEAEIHLTMSSCLQDAVINSAPRIVKYINKMEL